MNEHDLRVTWLCGPPGVGKSTVGFAVFSQLTREGTGAAFLDIDQIGLCLPADDPHAVPLRNLAALWPVYRAAGVRHLVLSGIVESPAQAVAYAGAVPDAPVHWYRLRAADDELKNRYLGRGWRPQRADDAIAASHALDQAALPARPIDTDARSVEEVAHLVRTTTSAPTTPSPHGVPAPRPCTEGRGSVLWICGPVGVGKSTVGFEVFLRLARKGAAAAYVDLRQLGFVCPAGQDGAVARAALAAMWPVFRAAGARTLIVAGDAEHGARTVPLPGGEPTVVRLDAGPDRLTERILRRGRGEGPAIPGDELRGRDPGLLRQVAGQAAQDGAALRRAGFGDVHMDTDQRTPT